jgi:Flp pilus assembly pilin Flp
MRTSADRGASAVEFGLLLAALAVGIIGAASLVGSLVNGILASAVSALTG